MRYGDAKVAGSAIFVGAAQFMVGMIVAEFLYPGYSVSVNYISDLGAICRQTCIIHQPSSSIFNSSVTILGVLTLAGSYFLQRTFRKRVLTLPIALTGVGASGVGIFPETAGVIHPIVSLIAFLFGGLSAIVAYKVVKPPLTYFSVLLGVISLGALGLFISNVDLGLGPGGIERIIAYPTLLWGIGFGAHLMNTSQ